MSLFSCERAMYGKDPITGTTDDAFRKNADGTPKPHKASKDATKFTSKESLVKGEEYVKNTQKYEDAIREAENAGDTYITVKDIKLEDVYGADYKNQVFGKTRIGTKNNPTGTTVTDFTDGTIIAKFQKDAFGKWQLDTMYAEPK